MFFQHVYDKSLAQASYFIGCQKAGAVPGTTVGYEKARNWAFRYKNDEAGFVKYLLTGQPEPPKYFAMMKKLNKVNRPLLTAVPTLKKISNEELKEAMAKGVQLIDTRNKVEFANGFIPGSINIQGSNSFATWAGWFLTMKSHLSYWLMNRNWMTLPVS